ncbi:hypothetical protein FOCG_13124 [Fusarium oxysporum f. sp. radicis-lycopersici 26381]|nr:hypothetical protein FOWG_11245 [Fusarium oxysporum f. sp. lycopersici MN25]EXL45758.1 hypothetical protein FOCG_13124 [Fusarium oxysporum f. sp. radicis-lycopersici 26381]EWZ86190.1 hypothetical protein FOWG_11245 [Fusarium oxysporum f. sp. lycopersici MN25]EWZ86191.1 hypothetical protein FOWG_11245 [Fusarium oxysporum f. sp. lycopersici MN25]EWZ86192.1 hypothetical protein FOWG_11245 [Fusarium oxysporum f. sp. lycopersici MN25]
MVHKALFTIALRPPKPRGTITRGVPCRVPGDLRSPRPCELHQVQQIEKQSLFRYFYSFFFFFFFLRLRTKSLLRLSPDVRTQSLVNLLPRRSSQPSNGSRPEPTTHPFLRRREQLPDRKHDTFNLGAIMHTRRGDWGNESDRSQHGVCCSGSTAFP